MPISIQNTIWSQYLENQIDMITGVWKLSLELETYQNIDPLSLCKANLLYVILALHKICA